MKQMTDKTRKIIFWIMFGFVMLIFIAAFVVGLVGLIKNTNSLTHLSLIFIPCGLLVNFINTLALKPNDKKSKKAIQAINKTKIYLL